jgi:3-oxoadipate enol-lactonase
MKINFLTQGHGAPIVFLHGIGGSAASWRWQLDAFSRTYRAIAWDMPGYGASAPLAAMTIANLAQALEQFLREQQIERPILVGHSIGGMVVQEYLATFPGNVSSVVLYATSPAFGRKEGTWQQEFVRARLGPLDAGKTMAELAPSIVASLIGSAAKAAGVALATACMAAVPAATYRAVILSLLDLTAAST